MVEQVGYIYVLSNKAMPGLLKIGYTQRTVEERARELSAATGVPYAFEVAYSIETLNPEDKESIIHKHLSKYRVSKKGKEFFKIHLEDAKHVIERVAKPLQPPDVPEPPELTEHQKSMRKEVVKVVLIIKYENRQKQIGLWRKRLEEMLKSTRETQRKRSNTGYMIKRVLTRKPKATSREQFDSIIAEYEDALKRLERFETIYTLDVFLKEHESVQGRDQVRDKFPSKALESSLGLRVRLEEDEFSRMTPYFIPTDNFPFSRWSDHDRFMPSMIESMSPKHRSQYKYHILFDPRYPIYNNLRIGAFIDWDFRQDFPTEFSLSPLFLEDRRLDELPLHASDFPHIYLLSDSEYRKAWREKWLRDWWKKADPEGYSPSNPFRD